MENYNFEITAGFGTLKEIADSLRELADAIYHETSMDHGKNLSTESIDGSTVGPAGLLTHITKA